MVHKLALVMGGIGALAVLAVALMLNGFSIVGPALADTSAAATPPASVSPTALAKDTIVETVVDTVYIEPPVGPAASFEARGRDDDDRAGRIGQDDDDRRGRGEDDDDDRRGRGDDDDDRHGRTGDDDDRHGGDDD